MKKVLSLILSVIIASVFGSVPFSVNADTKPGYIVLTDGSALSGDWKVNGNCISWVTMKYESDGENDYVLFDSNLERTRIYAGVYNHALMFHNAPVTVDLNEYSIFEFVYKMTNADTIAEGVTASDALMALQAAVKKTFLDADVEQAADVDGQEGLTASDALCILQYAVGKLSVFPADVAQ